MMMMTTTMMRFFLGDVYKKKRSINVNNTIKIQHKDQIQTRFTDSALLPYDNPEIVYILRLSDAVYTQYQPFCRTTL